MDIKREKETEFIPVIIKLETVQDLEDFRELFVRPHDESLIMYIRRKGYDAEQRNRLELLDSNIANMLEGM